MPGLPYHSQRGCDLVLYAPLVSVTYCDRGSIHSREMGPLEPNPISLPGLEAKGTAGMWGRWPIAVTHPDPANLVPKSAAQDSDRGKDGGRLME